MIPNVVGMMDLSPYEFRLYFYIKMVVGEDSPDHDLDYLSLRVCRMSTRSLAKACHISKPEIIIAKRNLIAAGLIYIEAHQNGSTAPQGIQIIKTWHKNHAMFHQMPLPQDLQSAPPVNLVTAPVNLVTAPVNLVIGAESGADTPKKRRKERREEDEEASAETASAASPSIPKDFQPLSELPGYIPGTHTKAFANIRRACTDAGVSVQDILAHFVPYYRAQRYRNGWKDPVKDLDRTVHIEISKVLRTDGGRDHGRANGISGGHSAQGDNVLADPTRRDAVRRRIAAGRGQTSGNGPPDHLPALQWPGEE